MASNTYQPMPSTNPHAQVNSHIVGQPPGGYQQPAVDQVGNFPQQRQPQMMYANEKYIGGMTVLFAILCPIPGCCFLACPIDERQVVVMADGPNTQYVAPVVMQR